jgi:hypothetical protein
VSQSEKVDLREYHYDMIKFRGLSEHHHELMCKHFQEVMDELGSVLPAGMLHARSPSPYRLPF